MDESSPGLDQLAGFQSELYASGDGLFWFAESLVRISFSDYYLVLGMLSVVQIVILGPSSTGFGSDAVVPSVSPTMFLLQ